MDEALQVSPAKMLAGPELRKQALEIAKEEFQLEHSIHFTEVVKPDSWHEAKKRYEVLQELQ